MTRFKAARIALALCGAIVASAPASAIAAVRYVGSGNDGVTTFDFDFSLPTFANPGDLAIQGVDGDCNAAVFGQSIPCFAINFPGNGEIDTFGGDVFQFGAGSESAFGNYVGTFNGAPGATLSVAPGAPAPLLGLGLLPALAAAGGLMGTRKRRKTVAA